VGPEEPDDEEREIGCTGILKFLISAIAIVLLASKFITGDWLWEYRGKWTNVKTYFPVSHGFSPRTVSNTNTERSLYLTG
jgi:hypothetical protein